MDTDDIRKAVGEFESRSRYSTLSPQILEGIEDDLLEQAIVDFVHIKIGDDFDREADVLDSLPPAVKAIYTTFFLEAEVANGGFQQYFWNSTGQFAPEALEALELIAANDHARVTKEAISLFLKELPVFRSFREIGTLEAFSESYDHTALGECDDAFYQAGDLSAIRVAYIRSNPDQFVAE